MQQAKSVPCLTTAYLSDLAMIPGTGLSTSKSLRLQRGTILISQVKINSIFKEDVTILRLCFILCISCTGFPESDIHLSQYYKCSRHAKHWKNESYVHSNGRRCAVPVVGLDKKMQVELVHVIHDVVAVSCDQVVVVVDFFL